MGRSVSVSMKDGKFVHQFWQGKKLIWEVSSPLIEDTEVILAWIEQGIHPNWTFR
jgi:hypothetical protein